MNHSVLDSLVKNIDIKDYTLNKIYIEPNIEMCTYEELTITFHSGRKLKLSIGCSGVLENLNFYIEELNR